MTILLPALAFLFVSLLAYAAYIAFAPTLAGHVERRLAEIGGTTMPVDPPSLAAPSGSGFGPAENPAVRGGGAAGRTGVFEGSRLTIARWAAETSGRSGGGAAPDGAPAPGGGAKVFRSGPRFGPAGAAP